MGGKELPAESRGVHYHYMDALRAAFMLAGVFVHASTLGDDTFFNGIAYASSLFRMEGFFLISGFLGAMLVGKYGAGRAVRRRILSVGVPLVATLTLFNPPTLWLTYNHHNDPDVSFLDYLSGNTIPNPVGELRWHLHLWFLVTLLVYALITPAAVNLLTRLVGTSAWPRVTEGRLRVMALITLFAVGTTVVIRGAHRAAVEPFLGSTPLDFPVEVTLEFSPFYLAGVLLYLDRQRLMPCFQRPAPLLLAVSGAALLAGEQGWVGPLGSSTGLVLSETVFTVALIATLFAISDRLVPGPRPAVRYLADASYTVYLFHYSWIYILATVLGIGPPVHWPQMLLVTALTFGVTLAIHHFVILRSAFLRKVFNGKFPAARRAPRHRATGNARRPATPATATGAMTGTPAEPAAAEWDPERTVRLSWSRRQRPQEFEQVYRRLRRLDQIQRNPGP